MGEKQEDLQFAEGLAEETKQQIRDFFAMEKDGFSVGTTPELLDEEKHAKYLRSPIWRKVIRPRVLERDQGKCRRCGGKADDVHHLSYADEVLEGKDDSQLASVCDGCHRVMHFTKSGARRRSLDEANRILSEKCEDKDFPPPNVDLRRRWPIYPPEWPRMTAVQRGGWWSEYCRLAEERSMKKTKEI